MSTQLFGVLYITLTGLVDSMVPNSRSWSLLGQSVYYIIKLAPILWWASPTGLAAPCPELPSASTYAWLPETKTYTVLKKKGRVKFYYINESSFALSMCNEYGYVPKALLDPLGIEL
ncbi:hypothetical protein DSO57_1026665 [Entomophthora muscae]|uniref:Uncharacterized protein n=1 Tax=Entomophthora muscae TaxID=34485 RepID=A0ACC2RT51_9FUNG|nr:hypothetical protein DSO57_1026665 [Entomophthora muscae]